MPEPAPQRFTYDASVFDVASLEQAKRIILTAENSTTDERWAKETPYMADLIGRHAALDSGSVLLDYGCGIGRLSKELMTRHGCAAVGIDISPSMRAFAGLYVQSSRFFACPAESLDILVGRGFAVDAAISIWVLQHCEKPAEEIARIRRALKPGGTLVIVNAHARVVPSVDIKRFTAVPTVERKWSDDGLDVRALLHDAFTPLEEGPIPATLPGIRGPDLYYWATFRRA